MAAAQTKTMAVRNSSHHRVTLGVQLLLGLVVLAAVVAVVAGFVIHDKEREFLSSLLREEKAKIFQLITFATLDDMISEDLPQIDTTLRQVIEHDPELIAVRIENETGSTLFGWRRQTPDVPNPKLIPSTFAFWELKARTLSLSQPIEFAGETFGHITVDWDVSKSDLDVARHTFLIIITV